MAKENVKNALGPFYELVKMTDPNFDYKLNMMDNFENLMKYDNDFSKFVREKKSIINKEVSK